MSDDRSGDADSDTTAETHTAVVAGSITRFDLYEMLQHLTHSSLSGGLVSTITDVQFSDLAMAVNVGLPCMASQPFRSCLAPSNSAS